MGYAVPLLINKIREQAAEMHNTTCRVWQLLHLAHLHFLIFFLVVVIHRFAINVVTYKALERHSNASYLCRPGCDDLRIRP